MNPCIVCGNKNTKRVIEMGFHPLADTFITKDELLSPQKLYPLNCLLCTRCGHLQNEIVVPRQERYVESNYSYTSSNSPSATAHWDEFCNTTSKFIDLNPGDAVVEFGSNDGYLIGQFQKKGARVVGIDPSPTMAGVANKKDILTICDFLSLKTIKKAIKKNGKAKLICGNNVLNHIERVNEALKVIKTGLAHDGYLVVEVPSLSEIVQKHLFDMIFHEHISTFSLKSLDYLFRKNGLYISRVEKILYHGGSFRVYASLKAENYNQEIKKNIAIEEKAKLFEPGTYKKFMQKIINDRNQCLAKIYRLKAKDKKIAAIGAGARSNTLLNFYRLDSAIIDFITDASIYKQGKFTPMSNIEIKHDAALISEKIDVALITAWNIGIYLTKKIKKTNAKIQFIVPGARKLM